MTSFLRDNPTRRIVSSRDDRPRRLYVVLGIIAAAIVLLFGRHFLSTRMVAAAQPFWIVEETVAGWVSPLTAPWAAKTELIEENKHLVQEIGHKDLEIQRLSRLIGDYRDIASLFSLHHTTDESTTLTGHIAYISQRPPVSAFDTLVLAIGNDEVKEKQYVFGPGNVLLGEIQEILGSNSKAILYSTSGHETAAFIKDKAPIKLKGTGNGNFVGELPKNLTIPVDTVIMLEGTNNVIARVGTTTIAEGDATQKVYARTPINLQALSWVYIVARD